jgi:hypothetical protein
MGTRTIYLVLATAAAAFAFSACDDTEDDSGGDADAYGADTEADHSGEGPCWYDPSLCDDDMASDVDRELGADANTDTRSDADMSADADSDDCSDGLENGDEEGIDCGGSCPAACAPRYFYSVLNDGTIYRYPDIASVLNAENDESVGTNSALAGDLDVFAFGGLIYRVDEAGNLYSYSDVAGLVANAGTLVGTNSGLTGFLDFVVSRKSAAGEGQSWIYAIMPVGDFDVCGIHSFPSPAAMVTNNFSYHGSAREESCYDYEEFFLASYDDRGAGTFYVSDDAGEIFHFEPTGPPTNRSWSDDFDYGTRVSVGTNTDLSEERNVGVFLF